MSRHYDVAAVRQASFPVTERLLYLDSAHQTAASPPAFREAFARVFIGKEVNLGARSRSGLRPGRAGFAPRVAKTPQCRAGRGLAFTKNTSEGMNIAANALPLAAGDNVLLVEGDHPQQRLCLSQSATQGSRGCAFVAADGRDGRAPPRCFRASYRYPHARRISRSRTSPFTRGTVSTHRRPSVAFCAQKRGSYFVIDAMQSIGVVPLDTATSGRKSDRERAANKGLLVPQGPSASSIAGRGSTSSSRRISPCPASLIRPGDYIAARRQHDRRRPGAGRF